jgi:hypothetical protein
MTEKGLFVLNKMTFLSATKKANHSQTQFAISIIRIETRRYVDKYFGVDPES